MINGIALNPTMDELLSIKGETTNKFIQKVE